MKCMAQEAKSPVKILSSSAARRDLIPALKGENEILESPGLNNMS
jgi:hypothetical protein